MHFNNNNNDNFKSLRLSKTMDDEIFYVSSKFFEKHEDECVVFQEEYDC